MNKEDFKVLEEIHKDVSDLYKYWFTDFELKTLPKIVHVICILIFLSIIFVTYYFSI